MKIDPVKELIEYVSYPSVSTDPDCAEGMENAKNFVVKHLKQLGFDVEVVKTPLYPIILGSRIKNPDWPHVMFYAHYDVQPADPFDLWHSEPFRPEVRSGMLYGRGACDNKGPFITQISALYELLDENPEIPLNFSFLVEGEEEIGSPSFNGFLNDYKDQLKKADVLIISDSCSPTADQVVITTGFRGLVDFEVEVIGPKQDLHSGLYGGPIMNPIRALSQICASLHLEDGTVNVPGFYDGIQTPQPWEREELKKFPINETEFKQYVGIDELVPLKGYSAMESIRFAPTLEFNGIGGGYQGRGSKTIIPSRAFVKITCRLVAGQAPEDIRGKVTDAIFERAPKGVEVKVHPHSGGLPYLVIPPHRSNSPRPYPKVLEKAFDAADRAISQVTGKAPLYIREGGSIPIIGSIKRVTGLDSLMIGLALITDNMHAPNESFSLSMMEKGIRLYKEMLKRIAN